MSRKPSSIFIDVFLISAIVSNTDCSPSIVSVGALSAVERDSIFDLLSANAVEAPRYTINDFGISEVVKKPDLKSFPYVSSHKVA